MSPKTVLATFGIAALVAAGVGGGYYYAATKAEMAEYDRQAAAAIPDGKKVLYWHDPMYPQHKFEKPGKSPFMEMQLVPVLGDAGGDGKSVRIDARLEQNLGSRAAPVTRRRLTNTASAVGTVGFDEGAVQIVQARVSGWVEKVFVRSPNDSVSAGQALAQVFSPEWLAAQEEYLSLRRAAQPELIGAARTRLTYLGIPEAQIAQLERDDKAQRSTTLYATASGVALPLAAESMGTGGPLMFAREGMQVTPGMTLFRIASLARVWVLADVPEAQAGLLAMGQSIEAETPAHPGQVFKGAVDAILPEVSTATRSLKARIAVANPGGALRPGMFVRVRLASGAPREALTVPSEAVIATGSRKVVMVAGLKGKFGAREVETGTEQRIDGLEVTEIKSGLSEGEMVVVSGQFLLDSEASLKAVAPSKPGTTAATAVEYSSEARIEAVKPDMVTLSHGPIPALKWPEMTMDFGAPQGGWPRQFKTGEQVAFSFVQTPEGSYRITRIAPKVGSGK